MSLLLILVSLIAFLLVLVIMVQEGKGGGLSSSAFGGEQLVGGVKETGDFLTKFTWVMAISFASLILVSNVILRGERSTAPETTIEQGE